LMGPGGEAQGPHRRVDAETAGVLALREHAREVVAGAAADVEDAPTARRRAVRDRLPQRGVGAGGQEAVPRPRHGVVVPTGGGGAGQQRSIARTGEVEGVPAPAAQGPLLERDALRAVRAAQAVEPGEQGGGNGSGHSRQGTCARCDATPQARTYCLRCSPVRVEASSTSSAGEPWKTTRPPSAPAPGPRSSRWSAWAITAWWCSMTITVFPESTRRSSRASSWSTSARCRPVVGSTST